MSVVVPPRVETMEPVDAGKVLVRALGADAARPVTVADASVKSGLALRDAEVGLTWLTSEYRGHLRVTEDGDLVHVFPHGFTKPWETREAFSRVLASVGRVLLGVGRFIVRAWLLIVMIGYALLFVALLVGLAFARQGSSDRDGGHATPILAGLLRMIGDALFWTFHPFSPIYLGAPIGERLETRPLRRGSEARGGAEDVAFYEKVNRFVFGPTVAKDDPHAMRARVLAEIRAQRGRIGLSDVMRVTGLPRHEADPLMARLMLDHDGTVDVADQGGIVYAFEGLRRTASEEAHPARPTPAWERPPELGPLTGNRAGSNVAITLLNAFNLGASAWVIAHGFTIANILRLFERRPPGTPLVLPDDGVPIALGVVPLVFSIAIFALPAIRALVRLRTEKQLAQERARLAVLREVLARAPRKEPISDETLRSAYRIATGDEPTSKQITARVVELGGDVDVGPEGEVRYRFADLEAEAEALAAERAQAPEGEARLGRIVYATDE